MRRPLDINLRHLDAVVAAGRCGSVSSAAHAVNLSQPALTHALAKLETAVGHRLFDRLPNGVMRTTAGALFLPRAEAALRRIADSVKALRRSARLKPIAYPERIVSLRQLRALSTVAAAGGYAGAARNAGGSHPSIRRAVKGLEDVLGVDLLVRAGPTMRPTAAAERLLTAVDLATSELEAGLDELAALNDAGAGRLVIGALALPRARVLPDALARFKADYPSFRVTVIEGAYAELISDLRSGAVDLVMGALRSPSPGPDLAQETLFVDDLFIVAKAGHPLAGPDMPGPEALARFPWVVGTRGAPMRAAWEALFKDRALPAAWVESPSIFLARRLLIQDDWLALMSRDQFSLEQDVGLLTAVGSALPASRRRIGMTMRQDWRPTAVQTAFIKTLRAVAA